MKIPPASPLKNDPVLDQPQARGPRRQGGDDPRITPEMRQAAQGLESVFTSEMMKAMRSTVEESEFSLKNSATEIYQGMLDHEYADVAAKQNSLGLSQQILDYWLRSMPQEHNINDRNPQVPGSVNTGGPGRTGGTHEDQSE